VDKFKGISLWFLFNMVVFINGLIIDDFYNSFNFDIELKIDKFEELLLMNKFINNLNLNVDD
jgi:hypothetical protein